MKNIRIISSKSDAHRALICGALSEKPCNIVCETTSKDIEATKKCLQALREGKKEMYCGESGSTLRFLLPVMAALGHKSEFYPEGRLPERPLTPLYEELVWHGCTLSPQGSVPFVIEGQLQPGDFIIPGDVSSQYISGLLFALPLLDGDSTIHVTGNFQSRAYVEMTLKVLREFGIEIKEEDNVFFVRGNQHYNGPDRYTVEGDWSNGCFWLGAGALLPEGICVSGLNLDSLQGDKKILDLLEEFGAKVERTKDEITVWGGNLKGIEIDASQIPDMVPILAVVACNADGDTVIKNAERLRIKESDRLATVTEELTALGADIEELPDGLIIHGKGPKEEENKKGEAAKPLKGGSAKSHNDHRIAMMAAIASLISENKVSITGKEAVAKSYPDFFQVMNKVSLDYNLDL